MRNPTRFCADCGYWEAVPGTDLCDTCTPQGDIPPLVLGDDDDDDAALDIDGRGGVE